MRRHIYLILFLCVALSLLAWAFFFKNKNFYIIDDRYTAQEVESRIQFIVLHFTHLNFEDSLEALTQGKVSAHYLVPQASVDGANVIYRLVDDNLKAAHAGLSYWQGQYSDGQINLNASSIGIEIVNLGYKDENGVRVWLPYMDHQIDLVIALLKDLVKKYEIEPTHIIGHGEITPNIPARGTNTRIDPGPLFPWEKLAAAGIGAWYDREVVNALLKDEPEKEIDILGLQKNLAKYGYNIQETGQLDEQTRNIVIAFQMHFRPQNYSGIPDQETCAILKNLIDKYFPDVVG